MDDILDIIHNIGFEVEDSQLNKLTSNLRNQAVEIGNLTRKNADYSRLLKKMSYDEVQGRQNIIKEMGRNKKALDENRKSLESLILTDKKFNEQLIKEQGLIGAVTTKLKFLQEQRKTATSESEVRRYTNLLASEQNRLRSLTSVKQNQASGFLGLGSNKILGSLGPISQMLPALGGALSLGAIGSQIFEVTKKFEGYNTTLKSSYGSSVQAQGAFDKIQKFAKETPFSVDELTGSFIKLKNRGFDPTKEELVSIGDLASSQGKGFDQLTEAILDAQTGEFERLKEFGIKAKTVGDTVTLSFKGIEKQVKKTDQEALRNAVISFGNLAGVTGQMAAQSKTLDGQLSNLGDTWDMIFDSIGKKGSPEMKQLIALVNELSGSFLDLVKNSPADDLRDQQNEVNGLIAGIASLNNFEGQRSELISEITAKYPELIKGIDLEKISSSELLAVLDGINRGYEKRIQLAETVSIKEKAQAKAKSAMDKAADIVTDASLQERLKEVDKSLKSNYAKMFNEAQGYRAKADVLYKAQAEMMDKKWTIPTVGLKSFNWLANDLIENTNEAQNQRNNATNASSTESKQNAALKKRYEELKKTLKTRSEYIAKLQKLDKEGKLGDQKYHLTNAEKDQGYFLNLDMQFGEKKKETTKTPPASDKKDKGKSALALAFEKIANDEKIAQNEEKKHFEEKQKEINDLYVKGEINKYQLEQRFEENRIKHEKNMAGITIRFAEKRQSALKNNKGKKGEYEKYSAEISSDQANIAEAKNKISALSREIKDRSEEEIKKAIETFNSLSDELSQIQDDTFQKERQRLQDQHDKKMRDIDARILDEKQKLVAAEESKNRTKIDIIKRNILREETIRKDLEDKRINDEIQLSIQQFNKKNEKQFEQQVVALKTFTENERLNFVKNYLFREEEIDKELKQLRQKGDNQEEIEKSTGLKREKLKKEQAKIQEKIANDEALVLLYLSYHKENRELGNLMLSLDKQNGIQRENTKAQIKIQQEKVDGIGKQIEAGSQKRNDLNQKEKDNELEKYAQLGEAAVQSAQTIVSAFEGQVDRQIEIQQRRVTRAQEIADRGNAEALQQEEKRLDKTQRAKEKFAKQQVALNLIMQASQIALAIATAAAETGIAAPAGIAIVLAALAAGFVAVKGFTADTPAFKDGVVGFNGKGTGTSDSNLVKISNGESVITAKGTMENREILEEINKGRNFKLLKFNGSVSRNETSSYDFEKITSELKAVKEAIQERTPNMIEIDQRGMVAMSEEVRLKQKRRKNL